MTKRMLFHGIFYSTFKRLHDNTPSLMYSAPAREPVLKVLRGVYQKSKEEPMEVKGTFNAQRFYETLAAILSRKYGVKVTATGVPCRK